MRTTVEEAQQKNIARMTDDKLRRELYLVSRFPEQPPIRVRYIEQMREEIARRASSHESSERGDDG